MYKIKFSERSARYTLVKGNYRFYSYSTLDELLDAMTTYYKNNYTTVLVDEYKDESSWKTIKNLRYNDFRELMINEYPELII